MNNFSGISNGQIQGMMEEAEAQLKESHLLEGGQQSDLRDFIQLCQQELAIRANRQIPQPFD